ncbi:MAG: DNA replication and repair protein RecF [Chitinophagia bacterium]|nr:DNA replication and repair protein RecF [Chitinophagia bacterium]
MASALRASPRRTGGIHPLHYPLIYPIFAYMLPTDSNAMPSAMIHQLRLFQYKNYGEATFTFGTGVNCITGNNGTGKTNLLDAIYFVCFTKSYFSPTNRQVVQAGTNSFALKATMQHGSKAQEIACKWQNGKKEISCNGIAYTSPVAHIGKFPAVMIAPDDVELITGGSEARRRWADSTLCQTNPQYLEQWLYYNKILAQRNALLKQAAGYPPDATLIAYYNGVLAQAATYIHHQRVGFTAAIVPLLHHYYTLISKCSALEDISIGYQSHLHTAPLQHLLEQSHNADRHLQRTTKGIHKDNWELTLNQSPFKHRASQGQRKNMLFALKLSQYSYLAQHTGITPLLLLDDIFEKLDQNRMQALLELILSHTHGQVLLTDTHYSRVAACISSTHNAHFIALG